MHMVAARLGFERAMVGTGWVTTHPDCMDRLGKHCSYLLQCCFWQGRLLGLAVSGCRAISSADYCMLIRTCINSSYGQCKSVKYSCIYAAYMNRGGVPGTRLARTASLTKVLHCSASSVVTQLKHR